MLTHSSGQPNGSNKPVLGWDHPDDAASRESLRALLILARKIRGMSPRRLSMSSGLGKNFIAAMENPGSTDTWAWKMSAIQSWSMALNMVMSVDIQDINMDPEVVMPAVARFPGLREPLWVGAEAIAALRAHRKSLGILDRQMAAEMGINRASLWYIEQRQNVRYSSIQRYARALGGIVFLRPRLWPLRGGSVGQV